MLKPAASRKRKHLFQHEDTWCHQILKSCQKEIFLKHTEFTIVFGHSKEMLFYNVAKLPDNTFVYLSAGLHEI